MAKVAKVSKVSLTAGEFDSKVKRLLTVKSLMEELQKEYGTLMEELESQYQNDAKVEEVVKGVNFKMVKVPVNQGRNTYDADRLIPFIKAIRGAYNKVFKKVVVRKMDIDTKYLDELVKNGKLPEEVLNKCRKDKWTFRSMFKRVEEDVTTTLENNKKRTTA